MKTKYISIDDQATINIEMSKWYSITDYRGRSLPGRFSPIKRDGKYYVCLNDLGGHVWVKPAEFVSEVK